MHEEKLCDIAAQAKFGRRQLSIFREILWEVFMQIQDSILNLHKNNGTVWARETGNSLSVMRAHNHC